MALVCLLNVTGSLLELLFEDSFVFLGLVLLLGLLEMLAFESTQGNGSA